MAVSERLSEESIYVHRLLEKIDYLEARIKTVVSDGSSVADPCLKMMQSSLDNLKQEHVFRTRFIELLRARTECKTQTHSSHPGCSELGVVCAGISTVYLGKIMDGDCNRMHFHHPRAENVYRPALQRRYMEFHQRRIELHDALKRCMQSSSVSALCSTADRRSPEQYNSSAKEASGEMLIKELYGERAGGLDDDWSCTTNV